LYENLQLDEMTIWHGNSVINPANTGAWLKISLFLNTRSGS
jgi:hypothetical protein